MSIVLGIDTGGTFTDAVLFDTVSGSVLAKSKSPTTHDALVVGIEKSIAGLIHDYDHAAFNQIKKIILSTTLATNAIVEGKGRPTGLIIIGEPPKGKTPEGLVIRIQGKVNVKGKEVIPLNEQEITAACESLKGRVEAAAVAGMMSVRNAAQELKVKSEIQALCGIPVVCSHELSSKLGFTDRTVTAVLNASLIPIIKNFIDSVKAALSKYRITAPIFMVKGDGNLASVNYIEEKPIESILSGPAASVIGALTLAKITDGVVVDMGGTTTDSGVVQNNTLALSPKGARVGNWQTLIRSAKINTFGLGGDTAIIVENQQPVLTTHRVLPACRGNAGAVTPTDIMIMQHGSDQSLLALLQKIDRTAASESVQNAAARCQCTPEAFIEAAETLICRTIKEQVFSLYDPNLPIVALGAPAQAWYSLMTDRSDRKIIIPEHYDVANAVGAAMAAVEERIEGLVRPDEENDGFVGHVGGQCFSDRDKNKVEDFVAEKAQQLSLKAALGQQSEDQISVQVFREEIIEHNGWRERYVETRITAVAKATGLKLGNEN